MKDQHHEIKITITNDDDDNNSIGNTSDDDHTISTSAAVADKGTSSRKSSIIELNLISSFLKQAYYEKGKF